MSIFLTEVILSDDIVKNLVICNWAWCNPSHGGGDVGDFQPIKVQHGDASCDPRFPESIIGGYGSRPSQS
jgi:hypothetical protein